MNILQSTRNNTPNAVTCCNLLSGALACVAAFHAFEPWWWGLQGYQVAFVLIALAAVFDFFDGFTARLLHAVSPLGDVPVLVVAGLVVALSLLMVCNLRMFSLKLHSLSVKENYKQYLLVLAFVICVGFCGVTGLAWAMLFYIVLSAVTKQD